ncbi:DMT family transporter [Caldibacillus debilis]|uniref:Permeases of the drug/metabolite transporter (DMT) superfamily n=1 Tax=Caldibacillus debilis GB1 TaxID=1339248 RepID=A0A420VI53_9BACI|nr:DMT family transporter [Caldibacillus debilis]RKO63352.1 Permeases of the drug/metabolite transporter (DMT) superfamily [Caldibacillus debilis GB1]
MKTQSETPAVNPYLVIAFGVFSVSTSAVLVKLAEAPAGVIAFYRLFFSVLLMLPVVLTRNLKDIGGFSLKDLFLSAVSGIFLAFHFILWFESLNYTSVASSTVLVTLQPLFSFAGTYLLYKERITFRTIVSGMVAIFGSILISWGDFNISREALFGDVLALIACALITGYLLFGQSVRKRVSLFPYTFVVYSISSVTLWIYVWANGQSFYPYRPQDWIYFLLLAVFPTLLGHTLFNWSLKWVSTNVISMAILSEPVGAALLAFFILGETLKWTQIIGGLIVLSGLFLFSKK